MKVSIPTSTSKPVPSASVAGMKIPVSTFNNKGTLSISKK